MLRTYRYFVFQIISISRCLFDLYSSAVFYWCLPRNRQTVAIVRVDNIGDFILWLDGARAIRKRYRKLRYRITLIASDKWSDFAESSGLFDEVVAVDRKRFRSEPKYRRLICRTIAKRRFETVINPTFSRDAWVDDFLVRASGGSIRIGQVGDRANHPSRRLKSMFDQWYTQLFSAAESAEHELGKNWQFARLFDESAQLRVPALEPSMIRWPSWLGKGENFFVLCPAADAAIRKWQINRFAEIAERVHVKTGWSAIVCGVAADSITARKLIATCNNIPIVDGCGRTTLLELAGIIAQAKLIITNETSAVHISAALARRAVAVLGGGHFGRFLPYPDAFGAASNIKVAYHSMPCYRCNWVCIHPRRPDEAGACIASVTVDDVWRLVEPMLLELSTDHSNFA